MGRRVRQLVAALLSVGAVVASGAPAAASPYVPDPVAPPVRFPASGWTGSLDSLSAAERARAVANATTARGASASLAVSGWSAPVKAGAGPVAVALTGLFLGFEGTNTVMRWAGVDDVGLQALFPEARDPGFIPNADVLAASPGWALGADTFASHWVDIYSNANLAPTQVRVFVEQAPPLGSPGPIRVRFVPLSGAPEGATHIAVWGTMGSGLFRVDEGSAVKSWDPYWYDEWNEPAYALTFAESPSATPRIVWYPVGHHARPEDPDVDPPRAWETRWVCAGGAALMAQSAIFHESDAVWPSPPQATCETFPLSVEVWEVAPLGGAEDVLFVSWTLPTNVQDLATNYPQCMDGSCTLELWRVDPVSGAKTSCFANPAACLDWWQDPNKGANYSCTYGGGVVGLEECRVYAPTFNVATRTPVKTQDGGTRDPAKTGPYADPVTGEPVPADTPGPGSDNAPQGCPPPFEFTFGGLGYWVTKGAQCALAWAFVPNGEEVATELQETQETFSERPPFTLIPPITATFEGLLDGWGSGCAGNVADFDPWQQGRLAFPCTPPQSAPLTVLYAIATAALVISTGFYFWSLIVSAMNGRGGGGES